MDNSFIRDEKGKFKIVDPIRIPTEEKKEPELFNEEVKSITPIEKESTTKKPKRKLKLFTIIFGILLLSFVLVLAVSYSKYNQDKPIDINLDNVDGLDLEGKDLSNSEDLVEILEQTKQLQDFSDNRVNPRFRVYYQGIEVFYTDHNGNIGGVGNLTLNDSEARGNGYGFFSYLGDSFNEITTGWFTDIFSERVNSTNVTTSKLCDGSDCYTPAELNITIPNTNETARFNALTTNCTAGNVVFGVYPNGTIVCVANLNLSDLETTYFLASAINVVTGSGSGALADIQTYNQTTYNVTEANSDFELRVNFTGITDFTTLLVRHKTSEVGGHSTAIQIWDYDSSSWEGYGYLSELTTSAMQTLGVYDDSEHISGGVVQVRFYQSEVGNAEHIHQFDWVGLSKGFGTPSGEEVDPYWTSEKTNYYNTTQTDTAIETANTSMEDYADNTFLTSYSNYTEDEIEAFIFDDDNAVNLNMSSHNITTVQCVNFDNGASWCGV